MLLQKENSELFIIFSYRLFYWLIMMLGLADSDI